MNPLSSVTEGISNLTRDALGNALHPVKAARVVGRLVHRTGQKPGTAPGTLTPTGPKRVEKTRIRVIEYDAERLEERELETVDEALAIRDDPPVGWLNIDGLHETEILARIRDHFNLHLLVMEDVVSPGQRAKVEEYEGYIFAVVPMLSFDEKSRSVETEQLSLVLGPTWVLTFQERPGDSFEPVRERLRTAYGRIRHRGPDYLAYALMDAVVDRYFGILERLGDVTEDLDLKIMDHPTQDIPHQVSHLKREFLLLRKSIWPLRDALASFIRTESPLVTESTQVFLRDVHDHSIQIIDSVETLRDLTSSMSDLYLSMVGQRTNEVMKVLTIMASIFIPLTFMAGIYGMNFEFMPELHFRWSYPILWAVMLVVAGGMIRFFRKKDWL